MRDLDLIINLVVSAAISAFLRRQELGWNSAKVRRQLHQLLHTG